jgi:hypothetical protein
MQANVYPAQLLCSATIHVGLAKGHGQNPTSQAEADEQARALQPIAIAAAVSRLGDVTAVRGVGYWDGGEEHTLVLTKYFFGQLHLSGEQRRTLAETLQDIALACRQEMVFAVVHDGSGCPEQIVCRTEDVE